MKYWITIIVSLSLISCKKDISFSIAGEVVNKTSGVVRLGQIGESSLDSKTCLVKNGKFNFEGKIAYPEEYFIAYKENENSRESRYFKFFISPGSINTIQLDPDTIWKSEFNGSEIGNHYHSLQNKAREKFDEVKNDWRPAYITSMEQNDSVGLAKIVKVLDSINQEEISWKKEFIVKNPESFISAIWLHKAQFNLSIDTLQLYFQFLDQNLIKSKYYIKVSDFLSAQVGKPFIDFTLNNSNGKEHRLSEIASNKVVLLDFWASWCKPCREHNVKLKKLYEDNRSKGFEVVGISIDRDTSSFNKAIKEDQMTWLNLIDRTDNEAVHKRYQNNSVPFNVLIDNNGNITYRATDYKNLEREVNKLLNNL